MLYSTFLVFRAIFGIFCGITKFHIYSTVYRGTNPKRCSVEPWMENADLHSKYTNIYQTMKFGSTLLSISAMERENFPVKYHIINQLDALISQIYFRRKICMFRTVPLSIIRSFSLYTQQWYKSYRFPDSCQQTCMSYTTAVCTVKNSS